MAAQVQFEVWMVKLYVLRTEKKIIKNEIIIKGIIIIIIITFITIHSINISVSDWLKSHR